MIDYRKIAKKFIKENSSILKGKTDGSQIAVALVTGLALGAVLSILFAPKRGNVTRRFIGNKSKRIYSDLKNKYITAEESVEELKEKAKHEIKEVKKTTASKKDDNMAKKHLNS